tara:strand:+ start:68 stop:1015 length:948 start_codon:yes stop_codon:yes gene_type:complete
LIACSNVAKKRFVPAVKASSLARISFVASRDPEKAASFASEINCPFSGSYEEAFASDEVDALYISTPFALKKSLMIRAIESGKHIIVEKPAFSSLSEAEEIIECSRSAGLHLIEGWMFKHHPQHAVFRDEICKDGFGPVKYFTGRFTYPRPPKGDIRLNPELLGGVFHDTIGYPIHASLMTINREPQSVHASLTYDEISGVDDFVKLNVIFEGGVHADLVSGFGLHYSSCYSVLCEDGSGTVMRAFSVNDDYTTSLEFENNSKKYELKVPPTNQFSLMVDSFCSDLLNYKYNRNDSEMRSCYKIIDMAASAAGIL